MVEANTQNSDERLYLWANASPVERTSSTAQIKAFAQQFDPQPFHQDEHSAKATVVAGLAASGWHTTAESAALVSLKILREPSTLARNGTVFGIGGFGPRI